MSRRAVAGAVVLVALATAGGYAIGSSRTPATETRTVTAPRPATGSLASGPQWSEGLLNGLSAGEAAGARRGAAAGRRRGRQAGRVAARDAAAEVKREQAAAVREQETQRRKLGGQVLVVGDSLEVLTSPYLQRYLPGVKLTINAVGGYSSPLLYKLFQESYAPAQSVIVFDAGTNDNPNYPQILEGRLQAVAQRIGQERCLVVPSIHGLPVDGVTDAAKNRVIAQFAASRPGTQVPDWRREATTHPEILQPDHLHPNAQGADIRARLVAEGIKACLQIESAFPVGGGG